VESKVVKLMVFLSRFLFSSCQVMELLVHLNKRIKSRPKIQLPVETLLVQYQDPSAVSFVTVSVSVLPRIVADLLVTSRIFFKAAVFRSVSFPGKYVTVKRLMF